MSRASRSQSREQLLANQNTAAVAHFEVYQPFCCPFQRLSLIFCRRGLCHLIQEQFHWQPWSFFPLCLIFCGFGRGNSFNSNVPRQKAKLCKTCVVLPHSQQPGHASSQGIHRLLEKNESWYSGMLSNPGKSNHFVWFGPMGTCTKQKLCFNLSFISFFFFLIFLQNASKIKVWERRQLSNPYGSKFHKLLSCSKMKQLSPTSLPLSVASSALRESQIRVISNSAPLPRTSSRWFIQKGFCTKDSLWRVGYVSGLLLGESCSKRSWMSVFRSVIIVKAWIWAFFTACVSQHFSNDHWLLPQSNKFPRLTRKKRNPPPLVLFHFIIICCFSRLTLLSLCFALAWMCPVPCN